MKTKKSERQILVNFLIIRAKIGYFTATPDPFEA